MPRTIGAARQLPGQGKRSVGIPLLQRLVVLPPLVTLGVPKISRGNYIFLSWVGDHSPRHVHVYRDGKLTVKWDLEHKCAMEGNAGKRIQRLINELEEEGRL